MVKRIHEPKTKTGNRCPEPGTGNRLRLIKNNFLQHKKQLYVICRKAIGAGLEHENFFTIPESFYYFRISCTLCFACRIPTKIVAQSRLYTGLPHSHQSGSGMPYPLAGNVFQSCTIC